MSSSDKEFARQRAERRRLRELDDRLRIQTEAAIRTVLDEYHQAGIPDDLIERICLIQNGLIKQVVSREKVIREMHDGVHRLAEEAAGRWMDGFQSYADQVRTHAAELNLSSAVVDSLLRNDPRQSEESREERNEAASQQVAWKRA